MAIVTPPENATQFFKDHVEELFPYYSDETVIKNFVRFRDGKEVLSYILNRYTKDLMWQCIGSQAKTVSPWDILCDEKLFKQMMDYIKKKSDFYEHHTAVWNVDSFMRNGSLTKKVSNFDPKQVQKIVRQFFGPITKGLTYVDTSAGWCARLCGALSLDMNYIGIDVNHELVKRLNLCGNFILDNKLSQGTFKILEQGSEIHNPELDGIADIVLTSPPYFNLEKYSDDNSASTKNYDNYPLWLSEFSRPTIQNIYKYLKVGGYAVINIKNNVAGGKEPLYDDWVKIFKEIDGFEELEPITYKVNKKAWCSDKQHFEPMMVFRKVK